MLDPEFTVDRIVAEPHILYPVEEEGRDEHKDETYGGPCVMLIKFQQNPKVGDSAGGAVDTHTRWVHAVFLSCSDV